MRLVVLSVLLIANLLANRVLAEDVFPQPLTRVDCDKAGMAWDDNANVCGAASLAAETARELQEAQPADAAAQPLTREDCDKAGMAWDDNANVCGAASPAEAVPEARETQSASEEPTAVTSTGLISSDQARTQKTGV